MADADNQLIQCFFWTKLFDYVNRKTAETGDRDAALRQILLAFAYESESLLPYRYKRTDELDSPWHKESLPIGYWWRDAIINWETSSASWRERLQPGGPLQLS